MVTGNLGENALLTFVRHRRMDGGNYALVRVDYGEKGLSYLDFALRKDEAGSVRIVDWHDYSQGQPYTASLRQAMVLLIPQERNLFGKLLGVEELNEKEGRGFVELARLLREQDFPGWLEKYDSLSEKLKLSRILLVTRVLIASASGDAGQYRLALGDVHEHLGDDPTLSLVLTDYYFYEEDYGAAQEALERLTEYTGGDAAIDHLRANIFLAEENYADSIEYARKAIAQDAAYEDSYWTLLDASVLTGQYQAAVGVIEDIETRFGYRLDPARLAEVDGYGGFAESEAFAQWKGTP
jgi:tetratricopeptide (TPR) repeat protein